MVPHAAPVQPAPPATFHVTAVFAVPVTVATNCCVLPNATVELLGVILSATGPPEFVGPGGLLVAFVNPAHPEMETLADRITRTSTNHS